MTDPLIVWMFMLLVQQHGVGAGMAGTEAECVTARQQQMDEYKKLGSQILAASGCFKVTLEPSK